MLRHTISSRSHFRCGMKRNLDTIARNGSLSQRPSKFQSLSSGKAVRMESPRLELNKQEQRLRHLLLDAIKATEPNGGGVSAASPVLRWAGGWVRDKLLGIPSDDIDVAIDTMTGVEFVKRLYDFCQTPAAIHAHGINPTDIGKQYKVARNPDRSKHLETASVKIFGLDLDFVNLRRETYADNSRNPQMEFGTAEEDALRRDATINALFYNLNRDEVEDFTGGLNDMKAHLIKTPLEPLQTFTDDPLRVLRLVRFASRLQFDIDENVEKYMGNEKVLESLRIKISRERVGIELEKMLKGAHPRDALKFIHRLGLYHAIFTDPTRTLPPPPLAARWPVVYECLDELLQNRTPGSISDLLLRTDDSTYLAWNLATLTPWMTIKDDESNAKLPLVAIVGREGCKHPSKLSNLIAAASRHRIDIINLKRAIEEEEEISIRPERLGMKIRAWDNKGGQWRLQVLNALLVDAIERLDQWETPYSQDKTRFLAEWQSFLDHLSESNAFEAPNIKRLIDGRQLADALGVRSGKWTGPALDICVEWQLKHPEKTDPAEAIEEVQRRRWELGLPES